MATATDVAKAPTKDELELWFKNNEERLSYDRKSRACEGVCKTVMTKIVAWFTQVKADTNKTACQRLGFVIAEEESAATVPWKEICTQRLGAAEVARIQEEYAKNMKRKSIRITRSHV